MFDTLYVAEAFQSIVIFILLKNIIWPLFQIVFIHTVGILMFSKRKSLKQYGDWAVISGATDGIGKAYAELLAKGGFNILLLARDEKKLCELAGHIECTYKKQVRTLKVDFAKSKIYDKIDAEIDKLDVGVLVNNVGFVPESCPVWCLSSKDLATTINTNLYSCLGLTRKVCTSMLARQRGGVVINISSFASCVPTPFISIYSASKAFIGNFGDSLSIETTAMNTGIIVQTLQPLYVATKLSNRSASFFVPTPNKFVNSALSLIGVQRVGNGCLRHDLMHYLLDSFSSRFFLTFYILAKAKKTARKFMELEIKT